jgi:hypothetical protein
MLLSKMALMFSHESRVTRLGENSPLGRNFASWAIATFDNFFENYRSATNLWATFPHGSSYVLILTKN